MSRRLITSRLGVRSQTVVPKAVRQALRLAPGDRLAYAIQDGRVEFTKLTRAQDGPFACFEEWAGDADTKGYATL